MFSRTPEEPSIASGEPKTPPGAIKKTSRTPSKKVSFLEEKSDFY